jgi:hypothetical protein
VDPVSLVVTAVVLGASAGLQDTATQVVKDAYAGLKKLLTRREVDVSGVERRPASDAQRAALEETLTDAPDAVDDELLAAAQAVTDAVAEHEPDTAPALGVDLERVKAGFLQIRSVDSAGTGVRGRDLDIADGITIGDVVAGRPDRSGAPDPSGR